MSKVFLREELEGIATFWRIMRSDGVTIGLTSHDRSLYFDGILHSASPGMLPSAIRRSSRLDADSAEVSGAISDAAIRSEDLQAGRFDGARIVIGVVDWETLERAVLYRGEVGAIVEESERFEVELLSDKTALAADHVARTSPTCRAVFCGPGCSLNGARFTHEAVCTTIDLENNEVSFTAGPLASNMAQGSLRWIDGPQTGLEMRVVRVNGNALVLDRSIDTGQAIGMRATLREGCDHTWSTCTNRFGNAVNFRGEPFLPGNDLLARYPTSSS